MIVVAIIAILASIVIPSFSSDARKGKSTTEVAAFFAELAVRQEQYKVDNGSYLAAPACPATPSQTLQDVTPCVVALQPWNTLRVLLPQVQVYCSYAITVGLAADVVTNPNGFVFQSPPMPWYYILATCEMDGEAGNSTYFTSSVNSAIQKLNEGQ